MKQVSKFALIGTTHCEITTGRASLVMIALTTGTDSTRETENHLAPPVASGRKTSELSEKAAKN